jgi:hypothetical protein
LLISPFVLVPCRCIARTQHKYRQSSRELKRLDSIAKSPLFADFSEMLEGCVTIRAFGAASRMHAVHFRRLDHHAEAWLILMAVNRWLGVRLDALAAAVLLAIASVVVVSRGR